MDSSSEPSDPYDSDFYYISDLDSMDGSEPLELADFFD